MPTISIKLNLPQEVWDVYQSNGKPLETALSQRLISCQDFTSEKPLYITDTLRRRLERLFGRNFQTPEELVHTMEKYITARIGEVDVPLQPLLLTRLKSRCFGKPFEQFLAERVVCGLEEYAGMR